MKRIVHVILVMIIGLVFSGCMVNQYTSFSKSKTLVQVDKKWKKATQLEFRTPIPASAETVWDEFKKKSFWLEMYHPRVRLKLLDSASTKTKRAEEVYKLVINRFVPFGKHYIVWEIIDDNNRIIQTREHGGYITNWDNKITITKVNDSSCVIVDQLVLRGTILNKLTATWAKGVLNQRHKNFKAHFETQFTTPFTEK